MAIKNLSAFAHAPNTPVHKQHSDEARSLSKRAAASGKPEDHAAAHAAHQKAAASHRARASEVRAAGNKLGANAHIASASVHEKLAEGHRTALGHPTPEPKPPEPKPVGSVGGHGEASAKAREATKRALGGNGDEQHKEAAGLHRDAALAHRRRSEELKASGNKAAAAAHSASAAVHERHADAHAEKQFLTGPKGGRYYLNERGEKVYDDESKRLGAEKAAKGAKPPEPKPKPDASATAGGSSGGGGASANSKELEERFGKLDFADGGKMSLFRERNERMQADADEGSRDARDSMSSASHLSAAAGHEIMAARYDHYANALSQNDQPWARQGAERYRALAESSRMAQSGHEKMVKQLEEVAKIAHPLQEHQVTPMFIRTLMRTPAERMAAAANEGGLRRPNGVYERPPKDGEEVMKRVQTVMGELNDSSITVTGVKFQDPYCATLGAAAYAGWNGHIGFRGTAEELHRASQEAWEGKHDIRKTEMLATAVHEMQHMSGDKRKAQFVGFERVAYQQEPNRGLEEGLTETLAEMRLQSVIRMVSSQEDSRDMNYGQARAYYAECDSLRIVSRWATTVTGSAPPHRESYRVAKINVEEIASQTAKAEKFLSFLSNKTVSGDNRYNEIANRLAEKHNPQMSWAAKEPLRGVLRVAFSIKEHNSSWNTQEAKHQAISAAIGHVLYSGGGDRVVAELREVLANPGSSGEGLQRFIEKHTYSAGGAS